MELSIFLNTMFWQLFELFIWLLGAFLIGLYSGKMISSKNNTKAKIENENDLKITEQKPKIRATKTFDRGGKLFVNTIPNSNIDNGLDFNRIGFAYKKNKNDLKIIKGIGANIEQKLNELGIYTYEQISNFNSDDIKKINQILKFFPGRIERDDWVGQAFNLTLTIQKKREP
jgi:hypothetical protein